MSIKTQMCALIIAALTCMLCGCSQGKPAFLEIQICLKGPGDRLAFKRELQSIAQSQGITFLDNSANTEKELDVIGNQNVSKSLVRPVVNMGMRRKDGAALIATNVGLSRNQILVGFTDGSNPGGAHEFANMVVKRIAEHWPVEVAATGTGTASSRSCD